VSGKLQIAETFETCVPDLKTYEFYTVGFDAIEARYNFLVGVHSELDDDRQTCPAQAVIDFATNGSGISSPSQLYFIEGIEHVGCEDRIAQIQLGFFGLARDKLQRVVHMQDASQR
jgi:hypothetical protein